MTIQELEKKQNEMIAEIYKAMLDYEVEVKKTLSEYAKVMEKHEKALKELIK